MYEEDTISAVATAAGDGGVAIIRISGPDAERIALEIFVPAQAGRSDFESHHLYYGIIRDPKRDQVLDQVLLAIMRKPQSYTGEDVVEIHCHGGSFLVRQILSLVLLHGARHAEPGEFTKRAFLNGRIDLAQAEGVLELIRAQTDKGLELAVQQTSGELSKWVHHLREELLDNLVEIEAAIDFPEEEIELLQRQDLARKIGALKAKLDEIIASYEWGQLFREGARVCICGRPNVGKSSLLNALLGHDRVIVTPVAGTTRDIIEESVNLAGLPVVLWDTAGIRDTADEIEKIGVDRSRQHVEKADALLILLDGSEELTDEDRQLLGAAGGRKALIVINKSDLPPRLMDDEVAKGAIPVLHISARTSEGIPELRHRLRALLLGSNIEPPIILSNLRHRNALAVSARALEHARASLLDSWAPEFVAVDLNEAREGLEEIIGVIQNDDILERIFSNFCIGK